MIESLPVLFIGAGVRAGEKRPGAGQKRTGSATLVAALYLVASFSLSSSSLLKSFSLSSSTVPWPFSLDLRAVCEGRSRLLYCLDMADRSRSRRLVPPCATIRV